MLNVHLNLSLEALVIFESLLEFKINEESEVVVEPENFLLAVFVVLQLALEVDRIATINNVRRTAIDTVTVLGRHEGLNMDAVLIIANCLRVVEAATVLALMLVLFNVDENIIGQANMHESINTTTVGLQRLGLSNVFGEIGENKAVLSL